MNGQANLAIAQNNQVLLAEIFGNNPANGQAPLSARPPPTNHRSAVDDILGLYGPGGSVPASAPAAAPPSSYLSTPISAVFPPSQTRKQSPPFSAVPPTQSVASRPTSYTAYDKNELKVTLTPQTSAAKPGVVMILARFQVSGPNPATGLNFQAAVPKVRLCSLG
jgi:AP-1 complex subunit gamma-1